MCVNLLKQHVSGPTPSHQSFVGQGGGGGGGLSMTSIGPALTSGASTQSLPTASHINPLPTSTATAAHTPTTNPTYMTTNPTVTTTATTAQ